MSQEETERFFEALKTSRNQTLCHIVAFLLLTGARVGEALSAEWQHVDSSKKALARTTHKIGTAENNYSLRASRWCASECQTLATNQFRGSANTVYICESKDHEGLYHHSKTVF